MVPWISQLSQLSQLPFGLFPCFFIKLCGQSSSNENAGGTVWMILGLLLPAVSDQGQVFRDKFAFKWDKPRFCPFLVINTRQISLDPLDPSL